MIILGPPSALHPGNLPVQFQSRAGVLLKTCWPRFFARFADHVFVSFLRNVGPLCVPIVAPIHHQFSMPLIICSSINLLKHFTMIVIDI
jgi:hypothetical protein